MRRAGEPSPRKIFPVKLSAAEHAQLTELARERGVAIGRLLVESALQGSLTGAERLRAIDELNRLNRLLANLTGNINQIAHQANVAQQVLDLDATHDALETIRELRVQGEAVLRAVG